jgi:DNA repair protein SbcD/Mre11
LFTIYIFTILTPKSKKAKESVIILENNVNFTIPYSTYSITMKVLHTADWHLGHYLKGQENHRYDEHNTFLQWLLDTIEDKKIDLLLIAGDIFDVASPPHRAEEQYYSFLAEIMRTHCKNVVIIGGNHDSPNKLNAPKEIFKYLNIHVVGGVEYDEYTKDAILSKEIIEIYDQAPQQPSLVVCAVPFLKDIDLRKATVGESLAETEQKIKEGIMQHYEQVAHLAMHYKQAKIPVLATGHLYTAGSSTDLASEKEIHIGNQGQVDANKFPELFDYIALGHIHRPQKVANKNHIRYAGSPIPLSFSEYNDKKIVIVFEINQNGLQEVQEINIPKEILRPLLRISGNLEEVRQKMQAASQQAYKFTPWVEAKVRLREYEAGLDEKVRTMGKEYQMNVLKVEPEYEQSVKNDGLESSLNQSLDEMKEIDVFKQKCKNENIDIENEKYKEVVEAFYVLLEEVKIG